MKKGNIEQRGDKKYRLTFDYNSKRYRKTIEAENKIEARKYLNNWISKIERDFNPERNYTIKEFSKIWINKQVLPNSKTSRSAKKYQHFLDNWFLPQYGNKYIDEITKENIIDFFNWMRSQKTKYSNRSEQKTLSHQTLLKYKSILHAMFETAVEWKKIPDNPCSNIKIINTTMKDTRVDYYRYTEYLYVLDLIDKQKGKILEIETDKTKKLRNFSRLLLIELALKTGLRRSEIFGLTKYEKDIDLENKMLDINKSRQNSKNGEKNNIIYKKQILIKENKLT